MSPILSDAKFSPVLLLKRFSPRRFDERELASHMTLLHEYNEIKDAGQILLGKLGMTGNLA
jgi:hypothetical protein